MKQRVCKMVMRSVTGWSGCGLGLKENSVKTHVSRLDDLECPGFGFGGLPTDKQWEARSH